MECPYIPTVSYARFSEGLYEKVAAERIPINGSFELTFRCNLRCVHCYCNLPLGEQGTINKELSTPEVFDIFDQIADAGCLWLLFTGGECLLRKDFFDIWAYAKKKGLLLTLFTNGTLINGDIADFLLEYPPFSIEISLYGIKRDTYESVTRTPGSYAQCLKGIEHLLEREIPVKLKTMVLTLNQHELRDIARYAKEVGAEFRFDAMVNPRLDSGKDPCRFRIDPKDVVRLDMEDEKRFEAWKEFCQKFLRSEKTDDLFTCGAGITTFNIDPFGKLQVCGMVTEPYWDLRKGLFSEGWEKLFVQVRGKKPTDRYTCGDCELYSLCDQCPGWALLENNDAELPVEYLCRITKKLAEALRIGGITWS